MFQSCQSVKVKPGSLHEGRAGRVVSDDGSAVVVALDAIADPETPHEEVTYQADELEAL